MLAQSKSNGDGLIRALEFLTPSAVVTVLTLLFVAPWVRIFPHIDEGLYMYQATRILEGQVIYRDFFQFTTPGVYYFLAAAYKIFGNSVLTGRLLMLALEMSMAYMVFLIARRFVPWAVAALAAGAYAVWLPESKPCLQHHTLSMFFAFACLTVILYMDHARSRGWIVAGALTFACALTTQSTGTYVAAAVALGLLADLWADRADFREALRSLTVFAGSILVLSALFVGMLLGASALDDFLYCTVAYPMENYLPFHSVGGYFGDEPLLMLHAADRGTSGWSLRVLNTFLAAFSQLAGFAWAAILVVARRRAAPPELHYLLTFSLAAFWTVYPNLQIAYAVRLFSPLGYLLFLVLVAHLVHGYLRESEIGMALGSKTSRISGRISVTLNFKLDLPGTSMLLRHLGALTFVGIVALLLLVDVTSFLNESKRRIDQGRPQRVYVETPRGRLWIAAGHQVTAELWTQLRLRIRERDWVFVFNWSSWIHYVCDAVNMTKLDGIYPDYSTQSSVSDVMHMLEANPPSIIVQDHQLERLRDHGDPRFLRYDDATYAEWPPNKFVADHYSVVWSNHTHTIFELRAERSRSESDNAAGTLMAGAAAK